MDIGERRVDETLVFNIWPGDVIIGKKVSCEPDKGVQLSSIVSLELVDRLK